MKLLIHDLNEKEWNKVASDYDGWEVISDNGSIRPCAGCFGCWLKTPGRCVIKDGYERMGELLHKADELVVMTRYTYGGFSSFVKNVFDRSIGYILPFFRIYKGEMHHQLRYSESKIVTYIFRGKELSEEDKAKARKYAEAVSTNFNAQIKEIRFDECDEQPEQKPSCDAVTVSQSSDVDTASDTKNTLPKSGKGKTIFLNCSPRGDNAHSKQFLDLLAEKTSGDIERLNISAYQNNLKELARLIGEADKVVLGMPLYVDGIPSTPLRLMELIEKETSHSTKKIYVVANMGFFESNQIENLLSMAKTWCGCCGFEYGGGIAIGAGEMMGQVLSFGSNGPARYVFEGLDKLASAVSASDTIDDIYTKANKFPRMLYFLAANSGMKKSGKQNGLSKKDMLAQIE
jgi:multimeric flavodoxin WrbA